MRYHLDILCARIPHGILPLNVHEQWTLEAPRHIYLSDITNIWRHQEVLLNYWACRGYNILEVVVAKVVPFNGEIKVVSPSCNKIVVMMMFMSVLYTMPQSLINIMDWVKKILSSHHGERDK